MKQTESAKSVHTPRRHVLQSLLFAALSGESVKVLAFHLSAQRLCVSAAAPKPLRNGVDSMPDKRQSYNGCEATTAAGHSVAARPSRLLQTLVGQSVYSKFRPNAP